MTRTPTRRSAAHSTRRSRRWVSRERECLVPRTRSAERRLVARSISLALSFPPHSFGGFFSPSLVPAFSLNASATCRRKAPRARKGEKEGKECGIRSFVRSLAHSLARAYMGSGIRPCTARARGFRPISTLALVPVDDPRVAADVFGKARTANSLGGL